MKQIELSIIIVNYKTKELVEECVRSIYFSKPKVSFEVIIVDNSGEIEKSNHYILITNRQNLGFSKANNKGIEAAKGKYVLLLNSDTKVTKGAIDTLYEFAIEREDAGAIGPRLLNPDGSIQPSAMYLPTLLRTIQASWMGKKDLMGTYIPKGTKPTTVEALVMAAFMMTPSALKEVGKLNEKYFMYFEDLDYCRALMERGLKVYYVPQAEVIHYHGQSGKKMAEDDMQWRRLIPSSKLYNGTFIHTLLFLITWSRRQWEKVFG